MANISTIQLNKNVIEKLRKAKEYPRQTYNELLEHMLMFFVKLRETNQYDEFLHKIQQIKMKEFLDNKDDEVWENA